MQDKLKALLTYQQGIKDKLTSAVPNKHAHRPEAYKQFLNRELSAVSEKIDALKLEGVK